MTVAIIQDRPQQVRLYVSQGHKHRKLSWTVDSSIARADSQDDKILALELSAADLEEPHHPNIRLKSAGIHELFSTWITRKLLITGHGSH